MVGDIIAQLAGRAAENLCSTDYLGEDGLLYCSECHYPKQAVVEEMKPYLAGGICCIPCLCMEEDSENERLRSRDSERQHRSTARRRDSLGGGRYAQLTFAQDNGSHESVTERCRGYVHHFDSIREQGRGLMLTGGTGKTFYACCIANALLDEGRDVWLVPQMSLLRACDDFDTDTQMFRRIGEAELMILDDLHTEGLTRRQTELLYEIADTRYRSGLPLIVTTLMNASELRQQSSVTLRRICDRILAMCVGADGRGELSL